VIVGYTDRRRTGAECRLITVTKRLQGMIVEPRSVMKLIHYERLANPVLERQQTVMTDQRATPGGHLLTVAPTIGRYAQTWTPLRRNEPPRRRTYRSRFLLSLSQCKFYQLCTTKSLLYPRAGTRLCIQGVPLQNSGVWIGNTSSTEAGVVSLRTHLMQPSRSVGYYSSSRIVLLYFLSSSELGNN